MSLNLSQARRGDFGKAQSFRDYELTTPVCVDALGETWTARVTDGPEQGRTVLVTVLEADLSQPILPRIVGAAQRAQHLRHPGILALLTLVEEDQQFALVDEHLEGEPLSTLLGAASAQSTPFPQGVALCVALSVVQTSLSLRAEDDRSIAFGGLAPEAIFLAHCGETLLRHPGVSAAAISRRELIHHPSCLSYRSPEQYAGLTPLTEAADVFTLGVLLWEMLAGTPLFGGKTHSSVGRKKSLPVDRAKQIERCCRQMVIPRLDQIPHAGGTLHPEVVGLVHRMLDRDPARRPSTFQHIEAALLALPKGLILGTGDVATTVDRLAGRIIAERRNEAAQSASVVLTRSTPSDRVTYRPEGRSRFSIDIPPHNLPPSIVEGPGARSAVPSAPRDRGPADSAILRREAPTIRGPNQPSARSGVPRWPGRR